MHTFFHLENLKERDCLEDMAIDQRLTLTLILEHITQGMDWVNLAVDRDKWKAPVNMAVNDVIP